MKQQQPIAQPIAPLYPELTELNDVQNYRLQKISEIEKTLINERDNRKSLYKKYKRAINISDGIDTGLISASIILASLGIVIPIIMPLTISAAVCGGLGMCVKLIRRKLTIKTQKHSNIKTIAESKINSIKDIVSKSLQDGDISDIEFKMVLNEMENYSTLKQEIKEKVKKLGNKRGRKKKIRRTRENGSNEQFTKKSKSFIIIYEYEKPPPYSE